MTGTMASDADLKRTIDELQLKVQARTAERDEARSEQAATADVLKVISRSGFDLQTALDTLIESAVKLGGSQRGGLYFRDGNVLRLRSHFGFTDEHVEHLRDHPLPISMETLAGRPALLGRTVHVPDVLDDPDFRNFAAMAIAKFRTFLGVPLKRDDEIFGVLAMNRPEPAPFTERQIELVQTFADQAVIAIENARLFDEVQTKTRDVEEALRYQTGSANILNVIASSPTDVQPVLKAIVESACELCEAHDALVLLKDGNSLRHGAHHGPIPYALGNWPINRNWAAARAFLDRKPIHVLDVFSAEGEEFPDTRERARRAGTRTYLCIPLLREGEGVGTIVLRRTEVNPFSDKQIALLQTFADQAVIAIGNVRLFEEVQAKTHDLEEALRYQTGSANILNVIASSPTDVEPVLRAIVESACELCEAYDAVIRLKVDDDLVLGAHHGPIPVLRHSWSISPNWTGGRSVIERRAVHVTDFLSGEGDEFPEGREWARQEGHRTILTVPLLREGASIGAITLRRQEVNPFQEKQIALLQTFADQAVIALGNVRLFEEVQARTRELAETLEYQTATSEVLNVISRSPNNLQPVMDTIVQTAQRLCTSEYALILQRDGKGFFRIIGHANARSEFLEWLKDNPVSEGDGSAVAIAADEKKTIHLTDALSDPRFTDLRRQRVSKARTMLAVPLMRETEVIGVVFLARTEVRPFTDKQVELVTSFADQAVIAIENVRLFDEVQAKTRDLEESLQQQTATADVLKVISRSAFDLQTVFETLVESAAQLCRADKAAILRLRDDKFQIVATHGFPAQFKEFMLAHPMDLDRGSVVGRAALERRSVQVPDILEDPEFKVVESQRRGGFRTVLGVPLMREGNPIGALFLTRGFVELFTQQQIDLVTTFADQAVIAIENARLFDEVQARTRDLQESLQQQTATADVLKVISRSAFDLQTVLDTLVQSAARLCESDEGVIFRPVEGGAYRLAAGYGLSPAKHAFLQSRSLRPGTRSMTGRAVIEGKVVHVEDALTVPGLVSENEPEPARTRLAVPLLREGAPIGVFVLVRREVGRFSDKQIELVQTFADQAVIAIENVRLFEEVQARTRELAKSLDDLRAAQDRLVQTEKLASLGQLTAGIAHEIKNPLNFVNNFSALSVELTDELNDALKQATLADKLRAEVDELTGLLKDNLAKVVQHGKRADSIVKNMLLHSREGTGEHRPADINALVDESLNLAYHGARAEKPQFNVTLQRNYDPPAGMVDVFPQEITRVFLNLLSNGFYAVTKRKADNGASFEPTVTAMTKGRTDGVEIRIRDNGTGIPPDVKEKMFNPFFTTKPAGEGTGLGLSMSYDIIVKQHGGTIDVETVPEEFTEFTIVLPRTSLSKKN